MPQSLKRLTIIIIAVLGVSGLFSRADAYVLQGPHILELMVEKLGDAKRLLISQRLIIHDRSLTHHPTEIRASLEAIRQRYNPRRLWCIFQPHQYSRTRFLLDDFAESFKLADVTIVPSIYFVRDSESARKEVNSEILVEKIRDRESDAVFIDDFEQIYKYLMKNVSEGDLVVTMGAGDIWKVADGYIQWLRDNS